MISFLALVISLRISFRISALKAFISNAGGSENSDPFTCYKRKRKLSLPIHFRSTIRTVNNKKCVNMKAALGKPSKLSPRWHCRNVYAIAESRRATMLRWMTRTMEVFASCYCSACAVACWTFPTFRASHRHLESANKVLISDARTFTHDVTLTESF